MEPVMVTLATMALNKIIEGGAGELGKGLTTGTLAKVNKLGQMIWDRIKGKPEVEANVPKLAQGDPEATAEIQGQIDKILQEGNSEFTQTVRQLAADIYQEIHSDVDAKNVLQVFGGQGMQITEKQDQPIMQILGNPTLNFGSKNP